MRSGTLFLCFLGGASLVFSGCLRQTANQGFVESDHSRPVEGGYYQDIAKRIEIPDSPLEPVIDLFRGCC